MPLSFVQCSKNLEERSTCKIFEYNQIWQRRSREQEPKRCIECQEEELDSKGTDNLTLVQAHKVVVPLNFYYGYQ